MAFFSGLNNSAPDRLVFSLDVYRRSNGLPGDQTFYAVDTTADNTHSNGRSNRRAISSRQPTSLSAREVAAPYHTQSNFSIAMARHFGQQSNSVQRINGTLCTIHDQKFLEFFCVRCKQPICVNCKLTAHEQHTAVDLNTAVDSTIRELIPEKNRLDRAVVDMTMGIEKTKAEQQAVLIKKAAVLKDIEGRYAILVEAAEKYKKEAVDSLNSVSTGIEITVANVLKEQEGNLNTLLNIQRQLNTATNNTTATEIFTVAEELLNGRASAQYVQMMTSQQVSIISRPVLHFKTTGDVMLQKLRDFFGTVSKVVSEADPSDMQIATQFQCGHSPDIEIFSLCHETQDSPRLWVSYERRSLEREAPAEQFSERGENKSRGATYFGKTSQKAHCGGLISLPQRQGGVDTFSKSLTAPFYKLENNLSGTAQVIRLTVSNEFLPRTTTETEFSINVGPHRAFDVDETGQFFVVVEEPAFPKTWRKVKLYQRPGGDPVITYTPPIEMFQPSDVCFYTLNDKHVLLVTDELNDGIHVVDLQSGSQPKFLAPGCSSLIQPTAITVDVYARLWLACRGGTVICMKPVGNR